MTDANERFTVCLWTNPEDGEKYYAEVEEIPQEELDDFLSLIEWYFLDQGGKWRECDYCGDKYSYFPYGIRRQRCYRPGCTEQADQADYVVEQRRKEEQHQLKEENRLRKEAQLATDREAREIQQIEIQKKKTKHYERVQEGFGHIYVIAAANGLFKIGLTTTTVEKRLYSLETMSPVPLTLIHSIESDQVRSVERLVHEKFDEKRKRGEWFELSHDDVNWFQSLKDYELDQK